MAGRGDELGADAAATVGGAFEARRRCSTCGRSGHTSDKCPRCLACGLEHNTGRNLERWCPTRHTNGDQMDEEEGETIHCACAGYCGGHDGVGVMLKITAAPRSAERRALCISLGLADYDAFVAWSDRPRVRSGGGAVAAASAQSGPPLSKRARVDLPDDDPVEFSYFWNESAAGYLAFGVNADEFGVCALHFESDYVRRLQAIRGAVGIGGRFEAELISEAVCTVSSELTRRLIEAGGEWVIALSVPTALERPAIGRAFDGAFGRVAAVCTMSEARPSKPGELPGPKIAVVLDALAAEFGGRVREVLGQMLNDDGTGSFAAELRAAAGPGTGARVAEVVAEVLQAVQGVTQSQRQRVKTALKVRLKRVLAETAVGDLSELVGSESNIGELVADRDSWFEPQLSVCEDDHLRCAVARNSDPGMALRKHLGMESVYLAIALTEMLRQSSNGTADVDIVAVLPSAVHVRDGADAFNWGRKGVDGDLSLSRNVLKVSNVHADYLRVALLEVGLYLGDDDWHELATLLFRHYKLMTTGLPPPSAHRPARTGVLAAAAVPVAAAAAAADADADAAPIADADDAAAAQAKLLVSPSVSPFKDSSALLADIVSAAVSHPAAAKLTAAVRGGGGVKVVPGPGEAQGGVPAVGIVNAAKRVVADKLACRGGSSAWARAPAVA